MNQQTPLALPPPAGEAHWGAEMFFGARVIDALADINAAFLVLAGELHATRPGMPALGLPAHVLAQLTRPGGPPRVPALPFALFDLRFRDGRFWRNEAAASVSVKDAHATEVADRRLLRFARSAVTLAWHLAQAEPRAARISLGLEPASRDALAELPVGALEALARRVAPAVAARFCSRDRFWELLVAALRFTADAESVERLRLLGLQLQGAESARAQQLRRRLRHATTR